MKNKKLVFICPRCGSADTTEAVPLIVCNRCKHVGARGKFRSHAKRPEGIGREKTFSAAKERTTREIDE